MEKDCKNTVKKTGDLLMVIPLLYTRKNCDNGTVNKFTVFGSEHILKFK